MSQVKDSPKTDLYSQNTILGAENAEILKQLKKLVGQDSSGDVPPTAGDKQHTLDDLPKLLPALAAGSSSIALDILLDALGDQVRKQEVSSGLSSIKANAQSREIANKDKIAKIEEQIEKLEKAGFWDKFTKAFSIIGTILSVVVGSVMIATGVGAVGGAALILGGIALADSVLDSVGEAICGQGFGLTSLIGLAVSKISGSEEAGMWVKLGLDIALSIATIATTAGGSAASGASKIAEAASKAQKLTNTLVKAGSMTQSLVGVAGSATSIVSASYTYSAEMARADQKKLEAILEQIALMNDLTTEHLKKVLEEARKNSETVSDIVKDNAATQTEILTNGGGASMA